MRLSRQEEKIVKMLNEKVVDAKTLASYAALDLVLISPNANPPVCKLMDYSKYRYEQNKKAKEARKNQKIIVTKEVQLSPTIDVGDFNTKLRHARRFLEEGNKVKVTLRFRGREMAHAQQSKHILDDFAELLQDVATVEKPAKLEGRSMSMVLTIKR